MASNPNDPGFPNGIQVTKQNVTVDGRTHWVELPQRYYDWSFIMAHFPAPTSRVKQLLPDDGLEAVEIVPGLAVVSLAAFEYRHMATLASYNEVAVMVPVRFEPESRVPFLPLLSPDHYDVGFWVHHLPVTPQEPCDVGVGVWGLPKVFTPDITFHDSGWTRQCELRENGQHVLTLSVAMGETITEARRFYAFSVRNGALLKSLIDTRGQYHAWWGPAHASFTLGSHQVAQDLQALEVQNLAVAGLFAFSAKSRLHPGTVLDAVQSTAGSNLC